MSLVVDGLAVYRLARLVSRDRITRGLRDRVATSGPDLALDLVSCPWCLAVWFAGVGAVARVVAPRSWAVVSRALAVSAVAGLVSELGA